MYEGIGDGMRERYTWAEIHLDHIAHNIRAIRSRLPDSCRFMAVVKGDAYGHGIVPVARTALRAGAEELGVSNLREAVRLRSEGIESPILVLTPVAPEDADTAVRFRVAVPVFRAAWLGEMRKHKTDARPLLVHLKMDTGMGRIGIRSRNEFKEMVPLLRAGDIRVEGVYTHFATADQPDSGWYEAQYARFEQCRQWVEDAGFRQVKAHGANSAAALQYPEHASLDMVRVGAAVHGINPLEETLRQRIPVKLLPTFSLHSRLVQVKHVAKGTRIGYDLSYETSDHEWIGTVPVGYADGMLRGFSGRHVLVAGQVAPIVGNICMDQLMIRLPAYYPEGTKVTLIGSQQQREIDLHELAAHLGTIPQEIVTHIAARVPRSYV